MALITIRVYRLDPVTGEQAEVSSCSFRGEPSRTFVPASCEWPRCECPRCQAKATGPEGER
ncbi:hypothetical protein RKE29_20715 [Streptomyces sp. B1866]|uniref:hypothetical protein n=1 Tax=Streptomyces sp. B1866 TaxID=3075431 RepID=UPI002891DB3B|nr:hypothetical protein [Streptomyces sp. B1866]MDT3399037.1 hypothetical protein [Streptomyces sp. B1866]